MNLISCEKMKEIRRTLATESQSVRIKLSVGSSLLKILDLHGFES